MKNLLIVESPTKARTLANFLGRDFNIQSSYGHVRDLPKAKMGIEIENDFQPRYVIPTKSRKIANQLKKLAAGSECVYFATDEDREGEAISWHLNQIFKLPEDKIKRIVFHEITKEAILEALKNPRSIDQKLVDAQQARRILDRLVGYELSPFLWKKVVRGLSAGRVQSVALRLIVEREREIEVFKPEEYWLIEAQLAKKNKEELEAKLYKIEGKKLDKLAIKNKKEADKILNHLKEAAYQVKSVQKKEAKRNPPAPFTTSTFQQEANRTFGFPAKLTMFLAQQLYEGLEVGEKGPQGLITYMRTDSVNLADKFLSEAKSFIQQEFGPPYSPSSFRKYKAKSKLAQEAHEAIRPTEITRTPEKIKLYLDPKQFKIYQLIWKRALASQMKEAVFDQTSAEIEAGKYLFQASGLTVKFDGFLKLYPEKLSAQALPPLEKDEILQLIKLLPQQKFTQPPSRYSEAGLVKALEELGIGRPSTYAPIISIIQDRNYVRKEDRRFKPKEIGLLVNDVLVKHFPEVVDYQFTARLEDELDQIAQGQKEWQPVIKEFYYPFKEHLTMKHETVSKKELTETKTDRVCEKCGRPMVIKMGRFGKFLACTGFPDCRNTKPLNEKGEVEEPETVEEKCEKCGAPMVKKFGRYGPFLSCSRYPECKNIKKIENSTGVKCPACGQGEIVVKRSKKGRTFYACNQYPTCKFALWSKPTGEKCPDCGSLLVAGRNNTVQCSNKECGYKKQGTE